jgi:outer membrane lipoprotein LolB
MRALSGAACERSERMRLALRASPLLLLLLWLGACRSLAPLPAMSWPERRAALQAVERYSFSAQLAVATGSEGFSATLRWQQEGVASELLLRAPLGVGGARVDFDGTALHLIGADGTRSEGEAAHEQLVKILGFEPPLTSLRFWLLGVPDPSATAIESLDAAAHLAQLQQADWQVDYGEYGLSGGQWLPRQLSMRRGTLRMKLHIAQWRFG